MKLYQSECFTFSACYDAYELTFILYYDAAVYRYISDLHFLSGTVASKTMAVVEQ